MDTKIVNGFLFPKYDNACSRVIFNELEKFKNILPLCSKEAVVQAGGNVGVFAVELARHFKHVYSFEPDKYNYYCLKANTINISNIYTFNEGLGDKSINGHMIQPDNSDNCGSLTFSSGEGELKISTLDTINIKGSVGLIYLDIEGWEHKALIGAKQLINKDKPVIVVENKGLIPGFKSSGLEGSSEFRDWICSLGYEFKMRLMRDDVFISTTSKILT